VSFSQGTLIQRVRDLLTDNPWATTFTGNINNSTTTVPVPDGTRWDEGAVGEWQDTGEQWYTQSVAANNLTVIRGWNGTTAAAHNGSVTAITILRDPTFSYKKVQDAIELIMQQLWPYVYKKVTTSVVPVNGTVWYDLNAAALALISVTQASSTTPYRLYRYGQKGTGAPVGIQMNVPSAIGASGTAIGFPRGFQTTTTNIQVDYAAALTTATSGTICLPQTMEMGFALAAWWLR
jgi:hypothetical protein